MVGIPYVEHDEDKTAQTSDLETCENLNFEAA
jgi:hypothetical protein